MKKFLTLLEEDEKLLLHLHQHVYLSREFIEKHIYSRKKKDAETDEEKLVKAHEISVFRRLAQLMKAGYITKFALPISPGSGRPAHPSRCGPTRSGAAVRTTAATRGAPRRPVPVRRPRCHGW